MATLAELELKINTSSLDRASRKLDDLAKTSEKISEKPVRIKAETTQASAQFEQLGKTISAASTETTSLGKSFDFLKGLSAPLGAVKTSVSALIASFSTGDITAGIAGVASAFASLKSAAGTGNTALASTSTVAREASAGFGLMASTAAQGALTIKALSGAAATSKVSSVLAKETALTNTYTEAKERFLNLRSALPEADRAIVISRGFDALRADAPGRDAMERALKDKKAATDSIRSSRGISAGLNEVGVSANLAGTAVSTFARAAVVGIGGVIAVTAGAYLGFEAIARGARAAADDNDELARKLGVTTERLDALKVIASENGGSVEGLQKTFDKLSKSMAKLDGESEKTEFAFASLGIGMSDIAGKSESQVAGIIIRNFEALGQSTRATAAAAQLLGPGFREQLPAIVALSESIDTATDRVKRFGSVASPALVKAGGEQEIAATNLKLAWSGLANQIAESAGTSIKSMTELATSALSFLQKALKDGRDAKAEIARLGMQDTTDNRTRRTEIGEEEQAKLMAEQLAAGRGGAVFASDRKLLKERIDARVAAEIKGNAEVASELARVTARSTAAAGDSLRKKSEAAKDPSIKAPAAPKLNDPLGKLSNDAYLIYLDAVHKAQASSSIKNKEYDAAVSAAQANKIQDMADEHNAFTKGEADRASHLSSLARQAESIRAQLEPNYALAKALEVVNEAEREQLLTAEQATKARKSLADQMVTEQTTFSEGWKNAFKQYEKSALTAADAGSAAFSTFTDGMTAGIVDFALTGKASFRDFAKDVIKQIVAIYAKMVVTQLIGMFVGGSAQASFSGTSMGSSGFGSGLAYGNQDFGGYLAGGGTAEAGKTYVVGEERPELLRMGTTPGRVYPDRTGSSPQITNNNQVIIYGDVDSAERTNELQRAMGELIDVRTRAAIAEALRRGNMLNPV